MRPCPALAVRGVTKRFGEIVALNDVSFDVSPGEFVGVVGDNGAGKSTLIKILAGSLRPEAGELRIDGEPATFRGPRSARDHGIETVWQALALASDLDASGNAFLGRELVRRGLPSLIAPLRQREMRALTQARLEQLGLDIPGVGDGKPVKSLSGGQAQAVAIARSMMWAKSALLLDEPTAALSVRQTKAVFELARHASNRNLAVVMVTHSLPSVIEAADRVVVLRTGRVVADIATSECTVDRAIALIVGAE